MKTDPYGALYFCVGTADDFICFDYDSDGERVRLHSVINSETGAFIQDFDPPATVSYAEAPSVALGMVDAALDWCAENDVVHDVAGWSQSADYFARCVAAHVAQEPTPSRFSVEPLIHSVYDNGGETCDRYTVFTAETEPNGLRQCLGMSDKPTHPQGFSQFSSGTPGRHCGKRIAFSDLPLNIQQHVQARLST